MSRAFALFLAFTLLFQMSWAVAATYCRHEAAAGSATHFGHHVHVHKSEDAAKQVGDTLAVDDDCNWCHTGHAALVPVAFPAVVGDATATADSSQPFIPGSAPARAPDRPQWLRLA
jgi:hypothetical protein